MARASASRKMMSSRSTARPRGRWVLAAAAAVVLLVGAIVIVAGRDDDGGIAPATVQAQNRAFDVTPAALVTGYISEDGVERP